MDKISTDSFIIFACRYRKDIYGFYLDILSTIPFEMLAFAFGKSDSAVFIKVYSILHLNRLLRIVSVT